MADSKSKTYNVACTVRDQVYTLYTCPQNCRAYMNLLYIANATTTTPAISIEWIRADGSHMHIIGDKNLTAGETIQWSGGYIVFEAGDAMKATATAHASPHVDVLCTVEEFFLSNRSK
jgi:hypothetical protein